MKPIPSSWCPEVRAWLERAVREYNDTGGYGARQHKGPLEIVLDHIDAQEDQIRRLADALTTKAGRGEPTYEMAEAGVASLGSDDDRTPTEVVIDVYRAMSAAAPATSPETGEAT